MCHLMLFILLAICLTVNAETVHAGTEELFKNLLSEEHLRKDLHVLETTPSAEPTQNPTVEPTQTLNPTLSPTYVPTYKPTNIPTLEPTIEPTAQPTYVPTIAPSAEPTIEPTFRPTESGEYVIATSSTSLSNMENDEYQSSDKIAVCNATAQSAGVDFDDCVFDDDESTIEECPDAGCDDRRRKRRLTTTLYQGTAVTTLTVLVEDGESADDVADSITNNLEDAVNDGDFTTALQSAAKASGSTSLESADATSTEVETEVVDTAEAKGSSTTGGLNGGEIAGIVIGTIVFVILVGAGFYFLFMQDKGSAGNANNSNNNVEISL